MQIREATWGGKTDVLNGIGKIGLNLFIFVLLKQPSKYFKENGTLPTKM